MTTTRTRLGALVSAGVLSLGLAACGGDDTAGEATSTAGESAAEEADAEEDGADATEEADGSDDASDSAVADGEVIPVEDFLAMVKEPGEETLSSYTMTMDMEVQGQMVEAQGAADLSGDQAAMQLTMSLPQLGEIDLITVDGEVYVAMPGATPEGMYLHDSADSLGQGDAMGQADITQQWDLWEEGAQEVLYLGDEDVDGTELGRYQITVDPQAAAAAVGADADAVTAELGDTPIVYDVWLDDDHLMRRLDFDLDAMSAQMSMDNWGEPQDITAPSEDQIMDLGDMDTGGTGGSDG